MAITKINTPELLDINTTGAKQLPSGPTTGTGGRPTTGLTAGDFRYNTTDNRVEYYDGSAWFQIDDEALPVACTTDTINYPSGTTNTVYYKMSDATDSTLNGYNGTATDVDFNVQGKFGNAAEFNLSNSKINLPQTYGAEGENFSYSFWFKTTTSGGSIYDSQNIISKRNGANTFHLNITNANTLLISDWSGTMNKQSSTTVTDGVWRNVVFTYSNGSGLVYINGSVETSMSFTVNLPTQSISLGNNIGNWDGNSRNFGGSIDQVRIFSTTLTAANATSLYNEVQCVPTIVPTDYFNPLLYTGNGSTQSIDDLTFTPDLVWLKSRSSASWANFLQDSVRGVANFLISNSTGAQGTTTPNIVGSFDTNGFSVLGNGNSNNLNDTYVSWNWKAGGTPYINTDGTTTSIVSANQAAGFSIVQYTAAGTTIAGHGLSQAPELIIQRLYNIAQNWFVYSAPTGLEGYLNLNTTNALATDSTWISDVTNSTFTEAWTGNSYSYINYCWHSVAGYSKVGSYSGNQSLNVANQINFGFTPGFVMIKNTTNSGSQWMIFDSARTNGYALYANSNSTESNYSTDLLLSSQGLEFKSTNINLNQSGSTYIYLAIKEN